MSGNISGISSGLGNFIVNHKILCLLTLGLAILGFVVRGKIYSWIQQASNTAQRADLAARRPLSESDHSIPSTFTRSISSTSTPVRPETDSASLDHQRTDLHEIPPSSIQESFPVSPATASLMMEENERIRSEIINDQTKLPQPVDDYDIMDNINDWTRGYMANVLAGRTEAPTPLHLQAAQYINAQNICQETREHEIIPHVYVGNYDALRSIDPMQGNNPVRFTRVISVTRQSPTNGDEFYEANIPDTVDRVSVEVSDDDTAWSDLVNNFERFFKMIDDAREKGENILIHCSQGQSRSVTVMMAYLINRFHVTPEQALHYIRTKRFIAEPVPGLYNRLETYYQNM
jgi:hypothetical protein